jgi:hypothetical protein
MQNFTNSSPTVTNCTFRDNSALSADGGGMANNGNCSGTGTNCTFRNNGGANGGGIYNFDSNPTVTNCTFSGNHGNILGIGGMGGGMCNNQSSPTVANCTFSGNWADPFGGGMGGGIYSFDSNPTVTNCILWNDSPDEIYNSFTSAAVTYSDVEGGTGQSWFGTGCIDADPCFADANSADLRLGPMSLCIDAGDNDSVPADSADLDNDGNTVEPTPWDLDSRPRFADGDCNDSNVVDMGAYEFGWAYIGDFDGECDVDFGDWGLFAMAWLKEQGEAGYVPDYDISIPADNKIDWADLKIFCANWLCGK